MKWTFGIITDGNVGPRVVRVIRSIIDEIPDAEVLVVGGTKNDIPNEQPFCVVDNIYHIPFAENIKEAWITRKKNLVAKYASHENICLMHDYIALEPGWADAYKQFGNDWLTCTNKIINEDNKRFRDWAVIAHDAWHDFKDNKTPYFQGAGRLLNYNIVVTDNIARWIYYSGAYFCVKKSILLETPFDENRVWGQGEDVFFSRLVYFKYGAKAFNCNQYACVRLLKQKQSVDWEFLPELHE